MPITQRFSRPLPRALALGALGWMVGCVGNISDLDSKPGSAAQGSGGSASGKPGGSGAVGGAAPSSSPTGTTKAPVVAASPRLPRLGHRQWARTAQAFLRLPATPDVKLRADAEVTDAFETDDRARQVDPVLMHDYRAAADQLTDDLLGKPELYAAFVADAGAGDAATRLRQLVTTAWARAFRRPLGADEIERYVGLGMQAPGVADATDDEARLRAALGRVVRVALLSPHFLFRVELGDAKGDVVQDQVRLRPLTPTEYATRLSYTLFDAPPDEALLASAGQLATDAGRATLVTSMVADERASQMLLAFHASLYGVDTVRSATKDAGKLGGIAWVGSDAATEARMFLDAVTHADGGLREIMLSRSTFVNARLASVYGLPTDGLTDDTFAARELPTERAGILTRVAWTATEASPVERSTIKRGVYLRTRVLCGTIGSPPADAQARADAATLPAGPHTNRESVTFKTRFDDCAGCHHAIINPLGFAFEHFDFAGRYVAQDSGLPVDSSGKAAVGSDSVSFTDARSLIESVATSSEAHACYVGHLASWVLGRPLSEPDRSRLASIGERSRADAASSRALLVDLLTSLTFRSLVVENP